MVRILADATVDEDEPMSFDGSRSYDVEGGIMDPRWDFGDGTTAEGYEVTHSYSKSGLYKVRLTVKDEMGIEAWEEKDVHVLNPVPCPVIVGDKVGNVDREMVFDASPTQDNPSDLASLEYTWDYGDGSIGHGQMVTHAFKREGEHNVLLTVVDDDGAIGMVEHKVMVLAENLMDLLGTTVLKMEYEIDDGMDGEEGLSPGEAFGIHGDVDLVTELEGLGLIDMQDIEVRVLVLETGMRHVTNADELGGFSFALEAPEGPGEFTILMVATLEPLRSEVTILAKVMAPEEPASSMVVPISIGVVSATTGLMAIGAIGGTDIGRYKFFTLMIPLFTRIKKPKVLDHFERGRIYEHIRKNPGDSYSSIRRTLSMKNGALAHHLRVLETHEYIISKRDGMFKRFYPKGMKIPEGQYKSIQQNILEMIMSNPKISQKAISERLGVDRSTVNYHIKILMAMGVIRSEKEGRVKYYYYVGVKEPLPYSG
jgi:predicted transcriptional regulator/PKD repeat protein